ncbi:MAG TPA: hypothetical protein VMF64_08860 [Steroidobacteraceae bacterium]|nr:hypothetical protein [Steroidobacteraceae bacterium]
MRAAGLIASWSLAWSLAGCVTTGEPPDAISSACPASLVDGIRLSASVAQVPVPDGVSVTSGAVKMIAGVGRRVLFSVEVARTVPRVRVLESSLQLTTLGGTLAGWARVDRPAGAGAHQSIQVSGGYLRIAPFLPGQRLRTYTQSVDVLVLPGGQPASQLALRPGRMWDEAGRPTAPEALEVSLRPIQHMSVLDVVNASATLQLLAQHRSGSHESWECAIQSDFELVDHEAVLPRLWTLWPAQRAAPHDALALYNPAVGAFPMVFLDPATAAGFIRWLTETHATALAGYAIGWLAQTNATHFQAAPPGGLSDLAVKQLGSD